MADRFEINVVSHAVARILGMTGFVFVQSTPLEVLTDLLSDCLDRVIRLAGLGAEVSGRAQLLLGDVEFALRLMNYTADELEEHMRLNWQSTAMDLPRYPVDLGRQLNTDVNIMQPPTFHLGLASRDSAETADDDSESDDNTTKFGIFTHRNDHTENMTNETVEVEVKQVQRKKDKKNKNKDKKKKNKDKRKKNKDKKKKKKE